MTSDLVQFLRARLDEDERIARSTGGMAWLEFAEGGWVETAPVPKAEWKGPGDDGRHVASVRLTEDRAHIARHDPARVLREIDAKRQIISLHGGGLSKQPMFCVHCEHNTPCPTLLLLASMHANHPDYREEWRL